MFGSLNLLENAAIWTSRRPTKTSRITHKHPQRTSQKRSKFQGMTAMACPPWLLALLVVPLGTSRNLKDILKQLLLVFSIGLLGGLRCLNFRQLECQVYENWYHQKVVAGAQKHEAMYFS